MTTITTTPRPLPDGGRGLARDTRVRWALEEAGLPYEVRPTCKLALAAQLAVNAPAGRVRYFFRTNARYFWRSTWPR